MRPTHTYDEAISWISATHTHSQIHKLTADSTAWALQGLEARYTFVKFWGDCGGIMIGEGRDLKLVI